MDKDKGYEAVQQARNYYAALRAELYEKIPAEDRQGHFLRLFELADLTASALDAAEEELKPAE